MVGLLLTLLVVVLATTFLGVALPICMRSVRKTQAVHSLSERSRSTRIFSVAISIIILLGASGSLGFVLLHNQVRASYINPVIATDFADPDVLPVGQSYYAYATGDYGKNIQVAHSENLTSWKMLADALPVLPPWVSASGSQVWAPEVIQLNHTFVMYYTARERTSGRECLGVATSSTPQGPFKDMLHAPFLCQYGLGGDIDPDPKRFGNDLYLYFKSDGNCCQQKARIWVQQLTTDGLHTRGAPAELLKNDQPWEGDVVEAPDMVEQGGGYYLFYSGNSYASSSYAVGYARCQSPLGPCIKAGNNPILHSTKGSPSLVGPGGECIFTTGQETWIVYHGWVDIGNPAVPPVRAMYLDRLVWTDGVPSLRGPTSGAQVTH